MEEAKKIHVSPYYDFSVSSKLFGSKFNVFVREVDYNLVEKTMSLSFLNQIENNKELVLAYIKKLETSIDQICLTLKQCTQIGNEKSNQEQQIVFYNCVPLEHTQVVSRKNPDATGHVLTIKFSTYELS